MFWFLIIKKFDFFHQNILNNQSFVLIQVMRLRTVEKSLRITNTFLYNIEMQWICLFNSNKFSLKQPKCFSEHLLRIWDVRTSFLWNTWNFQLQKLFNMQICEISGNRNCQFLRHNATDDITISYKRVNTKVEFKNTSFYFIRKRINLASKEYFPSDY